MLNYISTNKGKYLRVKELADEYDIDVSHLNIDIDELEISDVEMVSKDKAYKAYNKVNNPVLVEDSGFYIEDYPNKKNFPGTLVKRSGISNNIELLLKTMADQTNRKCYFISCVTYYDGEEYYQFKSYSYGVLATEKRGTLPNSARSRLWEVFIPDGYIKTLAEMTDNERQEKSSNSNSAFKQFFEWYKEKVKILKKSIEKNT